MDAGKFWKGRGLRLSDTKKYGDVSSNFLQQGGIGFGMEFGAACGPVEAL